ncbi:MAG TPA: glycine cleavage T C-terminal barrel domain-containing protein [Bryobacteraceae bacterium]|nr:glycine cleavage T C-terminal barrel domain-containing protein [Bryobacteraceae bacterium]
MTGYQALREGAGWLDLDRRGRFWISGEDRARLLHAMTTNHIEQMNTGDSCYTFFLNDKGRILGDANVLAMEDRFLLDTEPETHDALFQHLDKYIIADDATLTDARKEITAIGVEGPLSRQVIDAIAGFGRAPFTVTGGAGARFFVPPAEREAFVARLESFGAVRASAEDARVVRLENFRPRYGEDFTDKSLVQETQLLHAVHFTKGCYLGQEIVERVRSRGQVHRLLVPLYVAGKEPPAAASPVKAGEAAVGETMSSAYSPALGKSVAFAVIRAEHARPGTPLTIDGAAAEVAAAKGI